MENDVSIISLTKIDVAKRQLITAIHLHFEGGDPVSTHALAHAAAEVASAVCRANGRKSFLDEHLRIQSLSGIPIKAARAAFKRSRNFLQHADQDPDEILEFDELDNDHLLILACVDLAKLDAAYDDAILAFFAWSSGVFARGAWNLISKIAPNWIRRIETPRSEQLAAGARLLALIKDDPATRESAASLLRWVVDLMQKANEPASSEDLRDS